MPDQTQPPQQQPQQIVIQNKTPVLGIVSIMIGLVGVPFMSFVLSPMAFVLGGISIMCKQVGTGIIAIILAIIGIMTSPILLSILGLGFIYASS